MLQKLANPLEQSPFMPMPMIMPMPMPLMPLMPMPMPMPMLLVIVIVLVFVIVLVLVLVIVLVLVLVLLIVLMVVLGMLLVAPLPLLSICHVIIERKPLTPMVKPGPPSRNLPNNATCRLMITKFKTIILLTGYNHIITVETRLHHIVAVTASVTMAYWE
jgi:hypothetical protein